MLQGHSVLTSGDLSLWLGTYWKISGAKTQQEPRQLLAAASPRITSPLAKSPDLELAAPAL